MKKFSKKRFIISIIVADFLIIFIYSAAVAIFAYTQNQQYNHSFGNNMSAYAQKLKNSDPDAIDSLVNGNSDKLYESLFDPSICVALYTKREDDTAQYVTADDFLSKKENNTKLSTSLDKVEDEKIGGFDYKTYAFRYEGNKYIKLFMRYDEVLAASFARSGVIFVVIVCICTALISTACIVLLATPALNNFVKQKEFINDVSHEIRTPLTVIRGNLEQIMTAPTRTVLDVSENLEACISEVEHITTLSQNLLSIISDNRVKVVKEKGFTLNESMTSVLDIYSEIISGENKTLIANIAQVESVCDLDKMKQLLIILLDNAIKYTRPNDKIKVTLRQLKKGFELSVADTGIGIARGDEEKIFERFFRGDNAQELQGTGLGLSIAKTIVDNHGGKIVATRNIPSGLIVTATFGEE
ncbi:MAG: HAMP domain-containing sensor histidine kinase [Clostridia bacterium]